MNRIMYELTIEFTDRPKKVLLFTHFDCVVIMIEIVYRLFTTVKGIKSVKL